MGITGLSPRVVSLLKFFCCFDGQGILLAKCQTIADVEVLRRLGRPIVKVVEMEPEEAVICQMTDAALAPEALNKQF